jgi:PEP-CTERM motif-containing protein
VVPGTVISGTITDTLNLWFLANIPGVGTITGHEAATSTGTWEAFLPLGSDVVDPGSFRIVNDTNTDPNGVLIVSSVPEPSTLALVGIGGFGLLSYGWRRRKRA